MMVYDSLLSGSVGARCNVPPAHICNEKKYGYFNAPDFLPLDLLFCRDRL